ALFLDEDRQLGAVSVETNTVDRPGEGSQRQSEFKGCFVPLPQAHRAVPGSSSQQLAVRAERDALDPISMRIQMGNHFTRRYPLHEDFSRLRAISPQRLVSVEAHAQHRRTIGTPPGSFGLSILGTK